MRNKYIHDTFVHNTKAAERIVPFLVTTLNISDVVDVGCGTGTWLKVFADHGMDILGIEGFHLDKQKLVIPEDKVLLHDLEKPLTINRRFNLAISLEVAEHLAPEVAKQFIADLTKLSDTILFSAAIPHQGGQNHANEQWQEYWVEMFSLYDYVPFDVIRPIFWNDVDIEPWYKQNTMLFLHEASENKVTVQDLQSFHSKSLVHPQLYTKKSLFLHRIQSGKDGMISAIKILAKSFLNALAR